MLLEQESLVVINVVLGREEGRFVGESTSIVN